MTREPLDSEVQGNRQTGFYFEFLEQLKIQSGTVSDGSKLGAHPDESLRQCLKGLYNCLLENQNPALQKILADLPNKRKHIDSTHLADLIARVVQYTFRKADDASYVQFSEQQWQSYFSELSSTELKNFEELLVSKEVATHVLTRYRGLAALSYIRNKALSTPIAVADIGCSLNFGLRSSVRGQSIEKDLTPLTDLSDEEQVLHALNAKKPQFAYALGVDIQEPDFDWVASCAYFSKYEENQKMLLKYKRLLDRDQSNGIPIHSLVTDVADKKVLEKVHGLGAPKFDIIYASMVMYQMSPETHTKALENIHALLQTDGIFVELTFKNPENWFLPWNAVTTVRFRQENGFSEPYQWIEWDSSRCSVVQPGSDYKKVSSMLSNV